MATSDRTFLLFPFTGGGGLGGGEGDEEEEEEEEGVLWELDSSSSSDDSTDELDSFTTFDLRCGGGEGLCSDSLLVEVVWSSGLF